MIAKKKAKPRVKAGTSKEAAAARKTRFADEYIKNGGNATHAAIAAGYSPNGAGQTASKLLKDPNVLARLKEHAAKAEEISGLSVERTLREIARIAYADPRRLYDASGNLIPVHQLDDESAAAVANVEVFEEFEGRGEDRSLAGYLRKVKMWDKNAALEKAMKYHGLYEKDNAQTGPVVIQVVDFSALHKKK